MLMQEIKDLLSEAKVKYPISFEVAGDFAAWSRQDTGSEKGTYPAPPFSQIKGAFESILYLRNASVIPTAVQICSPIRYQNYPFNYRGELRKSKSIKDGLTAQIRTTVLYKPCYRIHGLVVNNKKAFSDSSSRFMRINHAHSYQEQFNRRLTKGRNYRTPCLGLSEFLASYVGEFRPETKVQTDINAKIYSMLFYCFNSLSEGKWDPIYLQNVEIKNGTISFFKNLTFMNDGMVIKYPETMEINN